MMSGRTNARPTAMAAFRGRQFQGYGVRTTEGWVAVMAMGMSWSKTKCMTLGECRATLRAATHAGKFELFENIDDLLAIFDKLQPHEQPYILPEHITNVVGTMPKLSQRWW